jgi:hypothetical protein
MSRRYRNSFVKRVPELDSAETAFGGTARLTRSSV